jgi:hypothetical protein
MQNQEVSHATSVKRFFLTLFSFLFLTVSFSQVALAETKPSNKVLQLALKAYNKAVHSGVSKKNLITIIDYSLPSTQRRLWVLDLKQNKVIYHTLVAHGQGTGDNHAKHFSDRPGSHQSSLGLFRTGRTYSGKHGLSLELHGLEKGFNGNALSRRVVIHGAHYVSPGSVKSLGRLGRSWGCPALSPQEVKPVINTIKDGSLVFVYYPDKQWLNHSKFIG